MTLILVAGLGWLAVSVLVTGAMAAVFAGARKGEARNVPAWRRPSQPAVVVPSHPAVPALVVAAFLPSPRTAPADAPVAV